MSTTYNVIVGDTFETIARKRYGNEQESNRIAQANPGVSEPLSPGIVIIIPAIPDAPQDLPQQAASNDQDEVAILIDGERFRFWDAMQISMSMDSIDAIEFSAPFQADIPKFRETFRPFSYKSAVVTIGGDPVFTGTMVAPMPVVENNRRIVTVSCYSLPGVLNDCTAPASMADKLEFDGQGLNEISKSLAEPFGIGVEFTADQGAIFDETATLQPEKKILSFLIELAKQRKLVVSNDAVGKLVYQQSVSPGSPVARLQQGSSPVLSITPRFNPQQYYSHITAVEPVFVGLDGSQFTVKNPHLEGVIRPFVFKAPDTSEADVKAAVDAKIGRMFGDMTGYALNVATWRDFSGNLWKPNTTMMLLAPDAMVYNEYEFVIRNVNFKKEGKAKTAILDLVIPGSFSGEIPESLPWDE